MAYNVNYNDVRFQNVNKEEAAAKQEVSKTYDSMISQADQYYQKQEDAIQNYADTQTQLQQEQTDFAVEKIEQQKQQAEADYKKEQSGAYVDWQKQSNDYGVNAEKRATSGLSNTGYSESSQVSMYNTYQNRVATARESFSRAVLNYDNAIKEARLQNNSALAEIAYNALQQQLELSLQGFQYRNQLLLDKADKISALDSEYYSRYQNVLAQINAEKAFEEQQRQFNLNYNLQKKKLSSSGRRSGNSSGGIKNIEKEKGISDERLQKLSEIASDIYKAHPKEYLDDRGVSVAISGENLQSKAERDVVVAYLQELGMTLRPGRH